MSKHHCRSVTVVPSFRGLPLYNTDMSFIFSHEVMLLRIQNNLAKRSSRFLKRTFDIVCSIMILIIASPLMIYLWYKVTRDGGPAVLKGDMSLVGPRPIVSDELERYCDDVDYYLMAKPGMTGLWQVSGRNDVDYDTRVYFDSWYVKNWTLWNDIAILFKTAKVVLRRDGAY